MRFRRRVSKCPYLLGKGSPQTAPTFAVVPYHPTGSDFPMSSHRLTRTQLWQVLGPGRERPVKTTRISLKTSRICML